MSKPFDQGKDEILKLCQYFATNREKFLSPDIKEDHVRQMLIDHFFEALGWDVRNIAMKAPQYREVVPEDSLEVEGHQKAPDYTFRIGPMPLFYVEAKKCTVNINTDPGPAYQLRRYGWSAKVALSILTDFQDLAVYDCSLRPKPNDKASHARIKIFNFEEYPDRWRELWDLFSHEACWSGAFDQYAAFKRKRGTSEVDVEFLKEIEGWRESLARNIALRNMELSSDDLNAAVQLIIDRVVFLRMAEDRGIEPADQLLKLCEQPDIYTRFIKKLCHRADEKYNSGLFHFKKEAGVTENPDQITPKLIVDDKIFKLILQSLYFEHGSPYHFGVLPVEILGTVYERFLGKVIRLTAGHQAKIEEKPEVRKAGGVYYTPSYIVDYIVKHTVGMQIEGKSPAQLSGKKGKPPFRVLDMACGSGSFLIGTYQCLLGYYLKWYIDHSPETNKKSVYKEGRDGYYRLTIEEKKRILTTHIFGVDIDPQAVEVSKLSLLLKVLEGETSQTLGQQIQLFQERALPNLADNIKCGNSMIGLDYFSDKLTFDPTEMKRVNPFDWKTAFPNAINAGGFNCIIGNPPYDVMEKQRGEASWPHAALADYAHNKEDYRHALGGKLNLFRFFMVRALKFLIAGGRFGMIVPLSLAADISTAKTRKRILTALVDVTADCFPQKDNPLRRVFRDAKLSTLVIAGTASNAQPSEDEPIKVRTYRYNSFQDSRKECTVCLSDLRLLDDKNCPVPLANEDSWRICCKIHRDTRVIPLRAVEHFKITRGEINQTIYRNYITSNNHHARLLKGVEVGRFRLNTKLSQGLIEWFDEEKFLKKEVPREQTRLTRIATQRITGVDEKRRIVATMIDGPCYFADSTNSIQLVDQQNNEFCYLLGLLNSGLFQWRFKITSTNNNVGTNELEGMPYRRIESSNIADISNRDRIVNLVRSMLALNKQLANSESELQKKTIQRQIDTADVEIDRLIYGLYNLTDEEVGIIEKVD
jgi:hypothetical protein